MADVSAPSAQRPRPTAQELGFREVLGHYPTGVVVVTAIDVTGRPTGMTIGSFTSVSLDPPLIAFLPGRRSGTFARMREAPAFCVNVLAADQEDLCRRFATGGTGADRFAGVDWAPAPSGAPVLDGAVAWIDCGYHKVTEAGDHYVVLGRVNTLRVARPTRPLLFFQGGYGCFTPSSLRGLHGPDLIESVRPAGSAQSETDRLARTLAVECSLLSAVGDDLVTVAVTPAAGHTPESAVGDRIPLRAPLGDLYVAWQDEDTVTRWLDSAGTPDPEARECYRRRLDTARCRGWSMSLSGASPEDRLGSALRRYTEGDFTPHQQRRMEREIAEMSQAYEPVPLEPGRRYDVRSLVAPVFGPGGDVNLVLRLSRLPANATESQVRRWIALLTEAAARLSDPEGATTAREDRRSARTAA
ncbi:flavin reductase [Streptomyces sp. NPDC048106]|uniref:flavin reductase n=1 Tax=Streptomyces sp. NPDC048106 TaxID=3155750 RepID=UPI00345353BB